MPAAAKRWPAALRMHGILRAIMGGIGSHHDHSFVVQSLAFWGSLLLPGMALFLVGGAYWERLRRGQPARPAKQQVRGGATLATEWLGE